MKISHAYDTPALPIDVSGKHSKNTISKDLTVIEPLVKINIFDPTLSHHLTIRFCC